MGLRGSYEVVGMRALGSKTDKACHRRLAFLIFTKHDGNDHEHSSQSMLPLKPASPVNNLVKGEGT